MRKTVKVLLDAPTFTELALATAGAAVMAGVSGYAFAAGSPGVGWVAAVFSAAAASPWLVRAAFEARFWRHRRGVIAAAEEMTAHGKH
jgi:hypothetical protein